jgi:hypothetical protein
MELKVQDKWMLGNQFDRSWGNRWSWNDLKLISIPPMAFNRP